jgi:hypothetical protein
VTVTLVPVGIAKPSSNPVYTPTDKKSQKTISYNEFLSTFALFPMSVPLRVNGKLQPCTAYSTGLDCWYIVL